MRRHSVSITHTGGSVQVVATSVATIPAKSESYLDLSHKVMMIVTAIGYKVNILFAVAAGFNSLHQGFHDTSIARNFDAVAVIF